MNKHRLSIIMPAYNEERRIGKTLSAYEDFFEKIRAEHIFDYEILVVINNSTDKTLEIVEQYAKKNGRIRYLNLKPGGKGFAVIEGFRNALQRDNDLIGFVDADMATSPAEFFKLVDHLGRHDGIIASRYISGSVISPRPSFQRLIAKRAFNTLVRVLLLLPFRDTQCGAKIFKRATLTKILDKLIMSRWAFDVDLLFTLHRHGFTIREFPTRWTDKEYSKINFWKAGPGMALGVMRLRMMHSPARIFIKVYDKILFRVLKVT